MGRGGLADLPEPETLADLRAEILLMRHAVEGLRCELVRQRLIGAPPAPLPPVNPRAHRDELLRELGAAFHLGRTWPAAAQVLLCLAGKLAPPEGCEAVVEELLAAGNVPASQRQIHEILKD
jgi:hypothetical protein